MLSLMSAKKQKNKIVFTAAAKHHRVAAAAACNMPFDHKALPNLTHWPFKTLSNQLFSLSELV